MTVSVVVVDSGLSDLRGPKLAWHVEDAAIHQRGVAHTALKGKGICVFVVGNFTFDGFPVL